MKQKRSFSKNIQLKQTVYLIGGSTESIEAYNMDSQETEQISQPNFLQFCTSKQLHSFAQMQYPLKLRQNNDREKIDGGGEKVYILGNAKKPFMYVIDMKTEKVVKKGQPMGLDFFEFRTTLKVNDEFVFLIGGIDSSYTKVTRRASSLHLPTGEVKVLPKMIHHRYGFPSVVKGSYAYVFGGRKLGHDEDAIMNECQRFSFEKEKWEAIPPMKIRRHSSFALVLNNLIAVIGGYKGNNVLSSDIEVFSDTQNKWFEVERKFGLAIESMTVVEHRSHIYLFGGRTDEGDVSKVFKLDIEFKGQSKIEKGVRMNLDPVGSMSQPGSSLKIAVKQDGKALIFCHKSHVVETYDLQTHQIVKDGSKLNQKLVSLDNNDIKTYTFCY